jgi:hypothetical protein
VPPRVLDEFGDPQTEWDQALELMDRYLEERTEKASLDSASVNQTVDDYSTRSNLTGYAGPGSLNGGTTVKLVRCGTGPFAIMNELGERGVGDQDGGTYGWNRALARSKIEVLKVACSHSEAMRFPHVEVVHQAVLASEE